LEGIYKFKPEITLKSNTSRKSPAYSIILQAPYALYTKLREIPGIELICETMEDDLLKGLSAPETYSSILLPPRDVDNYYSYPGIFLTLLFLMIFAIWFTSGAFHLK
jgi:hypothetical protein